MAIHSPVETGLWARVHVKNHLIAENFFAHFFECENCYSATESLQCLE
jgi:hypothetical protein